MIATDRDALICDMAETYHIYDLRSLPVRTIATLAAGLGNNSRIKMKITGATAPTDTMLLAAILDQVNILRWFQTEDGQKNRNRPESIVNKLLHKEEEKPLQSFSTYEEFAAARARILNGD